MQKSKGDGKYLNLTSQSLSTHLQADEKSGEVSLSTEHF